jgi:tRNA1(Val) A37 N6-methylase TrmN6
VLVRAVKGGRAPTSIQPALILNDEPARPNPKVRGILAGTEILPLAIP